jgi:hypothetical protein
MATPQKYIRTFAGDMETLKGGGTPELAPLETKQQISTPAPQPPLAEQAATPLSAASSVASSVHTQEQMIPPVAKNVLKTYAGDFSERMKAEGASTVSVLAAEQDAGASATAFEMPAPRSRGAFLYGIVGGVFFLAALGVGYFAYSRYTSLSLPVPIIAELVAPITVEERASVQGSGKELLQHIQQSMVRPLPAGSVRLLSAPNATSTSIFSLLQMPVPGVVLRNIVSDVSIAGIVHTGGEQSPFFVLGVTSFGDTFAGLLQWEARMENDLKELFPPRPIPAVATSTASATTATTTPVLAKKSFIDKSIIDHDVRVLVDEQKREILLYGYWNQHTLVIARDTAAFTELLRRLATSRIYR